jgi:4-cresol dehydrogenase (hydroxylating) flavoprotein subunit
MANSSYETAFQEWEILLSPANVHRKKEANERYASSTTRQNPGKIIGALTPQTKHELPGIIKIASQNQIPLFPISTGHNWGYGSANPAAGSCIIVDLSNLNGIKKFDTELGLITVEPGVTFAALSDYLAKQGGDFISPRIGAGSRCSIVGNALERGRAEHPVDRFSSLMSLEAILADGSVYRSNINPLSGGFFKWGMGPYIDGIFGQSGIGIVTEATFLLSPRPAYSESFLVSCHPDAHLKNVVADIRDAFRHGVDTISSLKIEGPHRVLSRSIPYPLLPDRRKILDRETIKKELRALGLTQWTIVGSLEGEKEMVKAARKTLRRQFSNDRIFFFDASTFRTLTALRKFIPLSSLTRNQFPFLNVPNLFSGAAKGSSLSRGIPFPLWPHRERTDAEIVDVNSFDFDRDERCGLLFFTGVIPMQGKGVAGFAEEAEKICTDHQIEPILAFLNFSKIAFQVSLPLLFDKRNQEAEGNAFLCHKKLTEALKRHGGYLQRVPVHAMAYTVDRTDPFWKAAQRIKKAFDPQNIMAPGRYSFFEDSE